ncbi:hypothetical protein M9Y10_012742 [Tritrichomonas musculus]|uniref:Uncharacterized protein n=1 Tax=Tritrichomonas musculus TaxID=1915356 RepID=A0ABR2IEF9_9EUKA
MGNSISANHCINIKFLEDKNRENFLQTLGQCSKSDQKEIKDLKTLYSNHKETKNFVVMTKGEKTTPYLWHSENLFVCAITTPNPPIEDGYCAYHQYHSLPFITIHSDPISYNYLIYFMNRVRFYLEYEEFLRYIIHCDEKKDTECLKYVFPPDKGPTHEFPEMKIIVPYDIQLGEQTDATLETSVYEPNDQSEFIRVARDFPTQILSLSEPSQPELTTGGTSSFLKTVTEPSSINNITDTGGSSLFHPISEPNSINDDDITSATSFLNPISEPSGMSSNSSSSFFHQISEPSGINSSSASTGVSSQFGLVSEPTENNFSHASSSSSFFGLVSEPIQDTASQSSFFGLVSEPGFSGSNYDNESEPNRKSRRKFSGSKRAKSRGSKR